jgi:hypothetical protein
MGHAGLAFAFDVLGLQAVVSCTVRHNAAVACHDRAHRHEVRGRDPQPRHGRRMGSERDDALLGVCVLLPRDWDRFSAISLVL